MTAREAIETANDNIPLRDALMAVAGRRGVLDAKVLGNWLSKKANRVVNLKAAGDASGGSCAFESAGEKKTVALWRLAARG
jgi:hypothetical protein